jgi:hypothetical protein
VLHQKKAFKKQAKKNLTQRFRLENKVGMLLFHYGLESEVGKRLTEVVGLERLGEIEVSLKPRAELLRFRFDNEVGDPTREAAITEEMLLDIERWVTKEKFSKAGSDTKLIQALAKRSQELRN